MRVPISWLKEYVDFDDTPEGLAERLTFSGTEVEAIERVGGTFEGIVVGEVRTVEPHPDADRLTVCRVYDGTAEHAVVCGAPNVMARAKIPFAPVGVTLPNGVKLKKAKIRGVPSHGMLLAEDELGLSDDHTGVVILDDHWAAGTPLSEVLGPPETVLELEITPNRPDCLCLIGIAREVAALYNTGLKIPEVDLKEEDPPVEERTSVEIADTTGCPRYTARVLSGVRIKPSPDWMQRRLTLAGVRPINNVVDITNYVMLETGHPLHAFDQTLLKEGRIAVRRARPGEKMATLDEIERALTPDTLVIADAERPVAVAGIMGGAGSEIRDDTETVLLESACFDPMTIRATVRRLALTTESGYRFERGVDVGGVEWASRRAAALMADLAEARIARGVVDAYPELRQEWNVSCRWETVRSVTGMEISDDEIRSILESLTLAVTHADHAGCTVRVPTYRRDLEREVDLIEEVARIHGLDKVPTPSPQARIVPDAEDHRTNALIRLKSQLTGLGLHEIMNYSLVSDALLNLFDRSNAESRIVLPHPISADQSVLRTSLIPQMVETLGRNHARQIDEARFFELGRVFWQGPEGHTEEERLAIGLMGPAGRSMLDRRHPVNPDEMFLWMKGLLEALLDTQRIQDRRVEAADFPQFEPGLSVSVILEGQVRGRMGLVRSSIRREWRFAEPVAVAELAVEPLLAHMADIVTACSVAIYPAVTRDVALVADRSIRHEDIVGVIEKASPKELERIELFDIFEGEAIGRGKRSLAYSLTFRSPERTLTDEEVNGYHTSVKKALRATLNVTIREG